ncbi:hypothetical protein TNCV_4269261, partial [Trichonephila clavipes]
LINAVQLRIMPFLHGYEDASYPRCLPKAHVMCKRDVLDLKWTPRDRSHQHTACGNIM